MLRMNGLAPRLSREMRLLVLTIVVSGGVLLLLARLRFPEPPPAVDTAPLERLAARASFEELATRVARLETSIAPNLIVLRLAPRADATPIRFGDLADRFEAPGTDIHHVPALRIDATTAVAAIPPNVAVSGIVGPVGPAETAGIVARDPLRPIARLRVPEGQARALPQRTLSALQTPAYVVAVEGTRAGLTLRPVFLGRSDRFGSPRWARPLMPLGGVAVTPGALMFTLDGEFLGCAVQEEGTLAIVGAFDVLETVHGVRAEGTTVVDPGIGVQALTAAVAAATGAPRGVVITEVSAGPGSGVLEPGDVIVALDQKPVERPEALLFDLATRLAAGAVQMTVVRSGETRVIELSGPWTGAAPAEEDTEDAELQRVPGAGTRIASVTPGSAFAAAGVRAGDVIVRAGAAVAPTPAQLRAVLRDAPDGGSVLLVVRTGSLQRVTGLRVDRRSDGGAR